MSISNGVTWQSFPLFKIAAQIPFVGYFAEFIPTLSLSYKAEALRGRTPEALEVNIQLKSYAKITLFRSLTEIALLVSSVGFSILLAFGAAPFLMGLFSLIMIGKAVYQIRESNKVIDNNPDSPTYSGPILASA